MSSNVKRNSSLPATTKAVRAWLKGTTEGRAFLAAIQNGCLEEKCKSCEKTQTHSEKETPPVDYAAEMAVLGSILMLPEMAAKVQGMLSAAHFYGHGHGEIYRHLLGLAGTGGVDATLLTASLRGDGVLEEVGGTAHIAEIMYATPVAENATYYAAIVREMAWLRWLHRVAGDLSRDAFQQRESADALRKRLVKLAEQAGGAKRHSGD